MSNAAMMTALLIRVVIDIFFDTQGFVPESYQIYLTACVIHMRKASTDIY